MAITPIRIPEKEPQYLTREKVSKLYPECKGWLHTYLAISLNTGMRVGEVCSLTSQDVDFGHRVIKTRCDKDFITKGKRDRVVPLNDFLYEVLKNAPRHIQAP